MIARKPLICSIAAAALALCSVSFAEIRQFHGVDGIEWKTSEPFQSATLTVSGPGGFQASRQFETGETLYLPYQDVLKAGLSDGAYRFELVLNPAQLVSGEDAELIARMRRAGQDTSFAAADALGTITGTFEVRQGAVVDPTLMERSAQKDIVQNDDVIVTGSECVGFDCVNGESFGFDTLRLKENNLRLHFQDTSNSASFPSNDWRIVINDSSNGGGNYVAIEDSTAGRQVFRVDAGAPANSLRVDSQGDVGIGESNPVVELHVADGDSPTLRLEQDGSAGFTPQTWDIVGNEANFFVRDVTNSSRLPFRIKPGAPTNALFLAASGAIGVGTDSPQDELHIVSGNANRIRLTNTSKSVTADEDPNWVINSNGTFRISAGSDSAEVEINASGDVEIAGTLTTTGTTCGSGCDLVFSEEYRLESIDDHAASMWRLGYLPNVGPTLEGEPVNLTEKTGRMLNELEKAHIYIEQLHKRLEALEERLEP